MKMIKENNIFIEIVEKLKNNKGEKGVMEAFALLGKRFSCCRIALFDYHLYQDVFEKKYEWINEEKGDLEPLREKLNKDHFFDLEKKTMGEELKQVSDQESLSFFEQVKNGETMPEHFFYRYVVERENEIDGVVLLESAREFDEKEIECLGMLFYMLEEESSMTKSIQELQTTNNFLQTLYSKMQTGLLQCVMEEHALRMVRANEACFQIYGCTREQYLEVYGNSLERFVYVEDWPEVKECLERLQIGDEVMEYEHRYINYYGQMCWMHVNALKMVNDDREEVIQLIFVDITHAKQLEKDLEHEKERYRIALDSSSHVIFEYDILNDSYVSYGSFTDSSKPKTTPVSINAYKRKLLKGKVCDNDGIPDYLDFLSGNNKSSIEIREKYFENGREKHIWVAIEGTPIYEH